MAMEDYPYNSFCFEIEIHGNIVARFSEVSGFDATTDDVVEYREGDAAGIISHKLPGLTKYHNASFKRGVIDVLEFYQWIDDINQGNIKRKNIAIHLLEDTKEDVVATWILLNAWPCKYQGPDLKGNASKVAIEAIEFVYDGLARE